MNQLQKLGKHIQQRDKKIKLRPQGLDQWVVNLKDQLLTPLQEGVLKLKLRFTPVATKFPLVDIVAAVGEGPWKLKGVEAEDLCGRVCGILRLAKVPQDNLT